MDGGLEMSDKELTVEPRREQHHVLGNGIAPGGVMKGCAHTDSEYRSYIAFGTLPNPDCPAIAKWNAESQPKGSQQ